MLVSVKNINCVWDRNDNVIPKKNYFNKKITFLLVSCNLVHSYNISLLLEYISLLLEYIVVTLLDINISTRKLLNINKF